MSEALAWQDTSTEIDAILTRADELRVFPQVVNELLSLKNSDSTSNHSLEQVIAKDAVISGRIVRMANTAFYGQKKTVASLEKAIQVIGLFPTRDLALSLALATTVVGDHATLNRLWLHTARVAIIAHVMAGAVSRRLGPTAFLAGLLHDIGRLLLLSVDGERYGTLISAAAGFPSTEAEREAYGFSHADLGGECLIRWQLPDDIVRVVLHHHAHAPSPCFPLRPAAGDVLLGAVMLAEALEQRCAVADVQSATRIMADHPARLTLGLGDGRLMGLVQAAVDAIQDSQLISG